MDLARQLTAFLLCLGVVAGNAAACAGWAATREARMACCEGGRCPMHEGHSHESASGGAPTQADADGHCAASEREKPTPSTPTFSAEISFAALEPGIVLPTLVPALVLSDDWRTASPVPIAPVPRHVLLSVFLV